MSVWSRPYVTVLAADGSPVPWSVPAGGLPAGEPDPMALGLPVGAKLVLRWRAPGFTNPRHATLWVAHPGWADLLRDVLAAHADAGVGWRPDERGRPVRATGGRARTTTIAPGSAAGERPGEHSTPPPVATPALPGAVHVEGRVWASPHNPILVQVAAGALDLGPTVAELAEDLKAARYARSEAKNRGNISSVLSILKHVMTYREPLPDDPEEIAAWKLARLDLPGVELGASMHVRLLLVRDLDDAIAFRRHVDFRVERFNEQAVVRHQAQWERHLRALDAKARGTWRGGRLPQRPPEHVELREHPEQVKARTEQLFAQQLGAVLAIAHSRGALVGPNPWDGFAHDPSRTKGYRVPRLLLINERVVPAIGLVAELAEAIAATGPADPVRGCRTGARFRALVVASTSALRPSELFGLGPGDYLRGEEPRLRVYRSLTHVPAALNDGSGTFVSEGPKGRQAGGVREVPIPRAVADALDEHIAAGYASKHTLFTGHDGGPVNFGNITATHWRPAVSAVFGQSSVRQLRELEFRWLRKAALTWMLRAGLHPTKVAEIAGHSVNVLTTHYAGVVHSHSQRHLFTTWDDAWAWAVQETELV
ncbi:site-specific integrase [Actinotalea sp. JY-7876]|uniref:site-specific integrase n=1 Tax=Actinotalea sp. JY-7876 TaxID=2758442 RepID=UPI0015F3840E|nr:site-specific integrase [Actinotalea sp. JY-7876]